MESSYKKKQKTKRNLSDTSSESEDEDISRFPRFIILESQDDFPLAKLTICYRKSNINKSKA